MAVDPRYRADPSGDRGRPLTNPAIPSLALLTALAAPATPVASPSRAGVAAATSPPTHLKNTRAPSRSSGSSPSRHAISSNQHRTSRATGTLWSTSGT